MKTKRVLLVVLACALALLVFSGTALAQGHSFGTVDPIVSTDWLAENLGSDGLVIVDVRRASDYAASHIPDSVSIPFAMLACAWIAPPGPLLMELPSTEDLFPVLGGAGITPRSIVVVVGGSPPFFATRVATTLIWAGVKKVGILDGGFQKWFTEGRPWDDVPFDPDDVTYNRKVLKHMVVDTEDVEESIAICRSTILDARLNIDYLGGHIPTALSLPFSGIWNEDGTYKGAEALGSMAADVIDRPGKGHEIIVYCQVGGQASAWWFVLTQVLGYQNVKFYDGSAQGWTLAGNDFAN